jgi:acetoin utilization deacetylase AcuC-like enzyme
MTIVFHERYIDHIQENTMHPECPERLVAAVSKLKKEGLWKDILTPGPAIREDLLRVHTEEYLGLLETFGEGRVDIDAYMLPETWEIALLSAGGGVLAGDMAFKEEKPVMALLRPPGHHALPYRAMGFCYLNNIAIASAKIAEMEDAKVAIVDIDLHHGNGTNDTFWKSKEVLYISTHQYPFYPGSGGIGMIGEDEGKGYTVNIPFPRGCGDSSFEYAFDVLVEPILNQFEPSIIMISFGADAHYMDLLGSLSLSSPGNVALVRRLMGMSKALCKNRTGVYLEGGYNVNAQAEIIAGIVAGFEGKDIEYDYTEKRDVDCRGKRVVDKVADSLKDHWQL